MKQKKTRIPKISLLISVSVMLLLSTSAVCGYQVNTGDLTEEKVKTAVETWVRYVTAEPKPDAVIEKMDPYIVDGVTIAYIAHLKNGGYCICGANKLNLPVYLYSPQGKYDPFNPGFQYILQEIEGRLKYLQTIFEKHDPEIIKYAGRIEQRNLLWTDLMNGRVPASNQPPNSGSWPTMMILDLTTQWDQGEQWIPGAYNIFCPLGFNGGRTVAGCQAIANAQIMKYWNWPPYGIGNHSDQWDGDDSCGGNVGGGTLTVDCSDTYDWGNMANLYIWDSGLQGYRDENGNPLTQANVDAVAELCYEVGVTNDMDYGVCGSSAGTSAAEPSFEDHFYYDTDAYTGSASIDTVTEELQYLRPVWMRGESAIGGHAFVLYGYNTSTDPDRQFLMNMGHGDDAHVWYSFDSVPFNVSEDWVTHLAPINVKFYYSYSESPSGDGSPDNPFQSSINHAVEHVPDYGTLIFQAGYYYYFYNGDLTIDKPITLKGYDIIIKSGD